MKTKTFHIYEKVYGVNLLVLYGMEREKVRSYLEKKYAVDWQYGEDCLKGGAVLSFNKWPYHVLWLSNTHPKIDVIPKISHEVLHHVLRVCADKGLPTYPEIDNLIMDEPIAYLMEFYMREILTKLKK